MMYDVCGPGPNAHICTAIVLLIFRRGSRSIENAEFRRRDLLKLPSNVK